MKSEDNVAINSRGAHKGFGLVLVGGGHEVRSSSTEKNRKNENMSFVSC